MDHILLELIDDLESRVILFRPAGRWEINADQGKAKRTHESKPAYIGKILGVSRATVYRYVSLSEE